ncbi:MAG TPA: hypothetical protein VG871_06460 [Vicinamibacterales bacterium]|nr:hypothetical protein [Vicinamibacterales bacterium]
MRSPAKLAAIVIVLAASTTVLAQWPHYTPAGVPVGADGKVDSNAPTPRAADGHPDLSGVWEITRDPSLPPPARGRRGGGGGGFGNIGGNMPDQKAPYQPWAADLVKQRMANNSKDNPDAHCLPMGIGQLNAHPYPRKIIQTPKEVLLIYEASGTTVREVYLDGRPLPKKEDVDPWYNGYSVGHWDGDTLAIETTGFMDDGWLDVRGSPLTSEGKITERFRRPKFGLLELDETIDDPKAYTQPFTSKLFYRFSPDTQLIEFVCLDKDAQHYVGGQTPAAK